jgi:hypothetical protein
MKVEEFPTKNGISNYRLTPAGMGWFPKNMKVNATEYFKKFIRFQKGKDVWILSRAFYIGDYTAVSLGTKVSDEILKAITKKGFKLVKK